jgi:hypothetical protein
MGLRHGANRVDGQRLAARVLYSPSRAPSFSGRLEHRSVGVEVENQRAVFEPAAG